MNELELKELVALVRYFETQMKKLGVTVRLEEEAGPSIAAEFKPDVVILAAGGRPGVACDTRDQRAQGDQQRDAPPDAEALRKVSGPEGPGGAHEIMDAHREKGRYHGRRDPGVRTWRNSS